MKGFNKFTPKGKKIFIILAIVLFLGSYYNLFYTKQVKAINDIKKNIEKYEDEFKENEDFKKKVDGIDSEAKILKQKLENLRSVFPPVLMHDEVFVQIAQLAEGSNMTINSVSYGELEEVANLNDTKANSGKTTSTKATSKTASTKTTGEKTTDTDKNTGSTVSGEIKDTSILRILEALGLSKEKANSKGSSGNETIGDGKGFTLSITLNAQGTDSGIKNFLKRVSEIKNKVTFQKIQIENKGEEILKVDIILKYYGIMDQKATLEGNYLDINWEYEHSVQKENMFKAYEENIKLQDSKINLTENKENNVKVDKYDFTMRVLPYGNNMAPPTVSLTARSVDITTDIFRLPVVYGDNKFTEEVEISLKETEGKIYCRFKTEHETFPDKTNMVEFKPKGNEIKILVDSSKRESNTDTSAVELNITNSTNKNVIVDVINDDNKSPRVKINQTGDNISINFLN